MRVACGKGSEEGVVYVRAEAQLLREASGREKLELADATEREDSKMWDGMERKVGSMRPGSAVFVGRRPHQRCLPRRRRSGQPVSARALHRRRSGHLVAGDEAAIPRDSTSPLGLQPQRSVGGGCAQRK
jgi:hypothetical protein